MASAGRTRGSDDGDAPVGLGAIIGEVPDDVLEVLESSTTRRLIPAGSILFRRGEPADSVFLVVSGRLRLSMAGDEDALDAHVFEEVGGGTLTGSSALLEGARRAATAFAARDTDLIEIPASAIELLAARAPRAMLRLSIALLRGMRPPLARAPRPSRRTIAVLAGPGIDGDGFVRRLARHLDPICGGTAVVGPGHVQGFSDPAALAHRLHGIEEANEVVLYEAPAGEDVWTSRVLGRADRVLVLADAGNPGFARAVGALVERAGSRADLVLLHRTGAPRGGSGRWLRETGLRDVFHVRAGIERDVARLARIVSGRLTALVLGGGGARGFAHLGAMRALAEAGIEIDAVGGSSIGAIMATVPGDDMSLDGIEDLARARFHRVLDRTVPVVSLMKGERVARSLAEQFGDLDIADLWKPTFFVTTDLTTSTVVAHRHGSIVRVLRASTAIPGVFPPVAIEGGLHADGGVLNNLPVDLMRERFPDARTVASDVHPFETPEPADDPALWASGWEALWHRARRRNAPRAPGLADIMVRATMAASTRDRDRLVAEGAVDLYLPLDVRGVDPLDFRPVHEVAARGYRSARAAIERALESEANPDDEGE